MLLIEGDSAHDDDQDWDIVGDKVTDTLGDCNDDKQREELRLLSVGPNSSPSQIYLTCFALCWHESELGRRERSGDGN